jgi:peptidoglycan/xylan/chitin deacetylase (PgdA/CDA1 family)
VRRLVPALAVSLAGAAVLYALPAVTARGPARRLTPGLAGEGRPGGVALTFDDGLDPAGTRRDLRLAAGEITAVTGVRPRWFRPPYGVLSAGTLWAARDLGLGPVLWTVWGNDWRAGPPVHVAAEVMSNLRDGGTVLLHDSDCTSRPGSWRSTVGALPLLAGQLRERGLAVRTLGDHLGSPC